MSDPLIDAHNEIIAKYKAQIKELEDEIQIAKIDREVFRSENRSLKSELAFYKLQRWKEQNGQPE